MRELQSKTRRIPLASLMSVVQLLSFLGHWNNLSLLHSFSALLFHLMHRDKKELRSERNRKGRQGWMGPKDCVKEEKEFYSRLMA